MAKEKIQTIENLKKERVFHYEIIGIVLFISSMFMLFKLGLVGKYLLLIVKILFGDWYFLIVFLQIAYSIRCMIVHQKLRFSSIRYLGLFFIILALIILSHFSMHKYIKNFDGNLLKITLSLYFNNFKNVQIESIIGGGVIGSVIFYLGYFLFSELGVVLLCLIFLFLGVVFLCKKTIKDFVLMIINFFKNCYLKLKNAKRTIDKTVDLYDNSYNKKIRFKINHNNHQTEYNSSLKIASFKVEQLKKALNQINVFYKEISYLICHNATIYFIKSHYVIQISKVQGLLNNVFENYLIRYDDINKELIIEVSNEYQVPLSIYEVEALKDCVCFGMDDRNNQLELDSKTNKLLVCSKNIKETSKYIDSIIMNLIFHKVKIDYYLIDLYSSTKLRTSEEESSISDVINLINDRIDNFKEHGVSDFEKYKNVKPGAKLTLVIINGIDKIINTTDSLDRLKYLLQTSNIHGFIFIFTLFKNFEMMFSIASLFDYKLFFDNSSSLCSYTIGYQRFDLLNETNEGFLSYNDLVIRMTKLLCDKKEYESIKK